MPKVSALNRLSSLAPLMTIGFCLLLWWVLTYFHFINPLFLPDLNAMGAAFGKVFCSTEIYADVWKTTYRALLGLLISAIVAIPLGLVFGRIAWIYKFFEFPADFFRSIPSSALFPLFILFLGIGDSSKAGVVFYGCSLILLVNTVYGATPTREKQDRINMLRSFRATRYQVFKLAVLRDALPHIAAGMRVCVSLSFVLVIVTEMFLGATNGLGRQIYDYYLRYDIPEMYTVIILLGILGFVANKISTYLEREAIQHPQRLSIRFKRVLGIGKV